MLMPAAAASRSTNGPNLFNTPQAGFIVLAIVVIPVGFMLVFVAEVLYFRYLERRQAKAELAALSVQLQLQGRNTGSSTVSTQRPRWKRLLIATRAALAFNRPLTNARPTTKHRTNPRLSAFDLLESGNLPCLSPPSPALIRTRQSPYVYPLGTHRYSESADSSGTYYKAGSLGLGLSRANSNSMDARPLSVSGTYPLCLGTGIGLGFDLRPPSSAPLVQGTIASSRDSFGAPPAAYDFDEKAFVDVDMDADVDTKGKDELSACTGTGTMTPPPALPPTVALPASFRVSGSPISIDIAQCATLVSPPRYPSRYGYI